MALPCMAEQFTLLESDEAVASYFQRNTGNVLVVGGGSNVILPAQISQPVVRLGHNSIDVASETDAYVLLKVGAAVDWDSLVAWSVAQGYHGLENLSLIPGSVGAAPVQNIGAYGVELKDSLVSVRAYDRQINTFVELTNSECLFGYRDSVFKQSSGRFVITDVCLKLSKTPTFVLEYGELKAFAEKNRAALSAQSVRDKVIEVRQAKLPDPNQLPNTGSFFKNPVISRSKFEALEKRFPGLVGYPQLKVNDQSQTQSFGDDRTTEFKVAAGWLIDQAGLKGHRIGGMSVHDKQALVLVNSHNASQNDVLELANFVRQTVLDRYDIRLEIEPVLVTSLP